MKGYYGRRYRAGQAASMVPAGAELSCPPAGCAQPIPAGMSCGPYPKRECQDEILGIDSGAVAVPATTQAVIEQNARKCFCPRKLVVSPQIAPFFTVDDFEIGDDRQFTGAAAIPGDVLTPDAVDFALRAECVFPGLPLTLTVTNQDGAAHRFRAAIIGSSLVR